MSLSTVEELLAAFRKRLDVPWRPDETPAGRVWMLWYDKTHERRVRGRLGEFREAAVNAGKGWQEFDLAPCFGEWIARQKWFEQAARRPGTLGTVLPRFEQHLVELIRVEVASCSPNDLLVLTGGASLFGLLRVSGLLSRVADFVPGRLMVAFPGTHQGGIYKLLDARLGWDYLAVPIPSADVV